MNDWNTMPIFLRNSFTLAPRASMSCPSIITFPPVGCSNRLRQRRKVLLPVPEGPMMDITSPFSIVAVTFFSTARPSSYVFCRCSIAKRLMTYFLISWFNNVPSIHALAIYMRATMMSGGKASKVCERMRSEAFVMSTTAM